MRGVAAGKKQYRDILGGGIAFKLFTDFDPVHSGENNVEEYQIQLLGLRDLQALFAVIREYDPIIFFGKNPVHQFSLALIIIDKEDACGWKTRSGSLFKNRLGELSPHGH